MAAVGTSRSHVATSPTFPDPAISPRIDRWRATGVTHGGPTLMTKSARWYFGGLASTMAVCVTHPLDLLKVYLQTNQGCRVRIIPVTMDIISSQGFFALYNGLSASVLRQLTHTTARFGIYEALKPADPAKPFPFYVKIISAGFSGACGGFVGAPADLVNVRMQSDVRLPIEQRRNYRNAIDGLVRVCREEGILRLWSGSSMVIARAALLTIGQLSLYDQVKQTLLGWGFLDTVPTHLLASGLAACSSTAVTSPVDVLKTRMQNAKPGEYQNLRHCFYETGKLGPTAFFKGFIPAFVRIGPQTILMFLLYEQLRLHFGIPVK